MSAIFFFKMMQDRKRKKRQGDRYPCSNDFKKRKRSPIIKRSIETLKAVFSPNKDI